MPSIHDVWCGKTMDATVRSNSRKSTMTHLITILTQCWCVTDGHSTYRTCIVLSEAIKHHHVFPSLRQQIKCSHSSCLLKMIRHDCTSSDMTAPVVTAAHMRHSTTEARLLILCPKRDRDLPKFYRDRDL